MCKLDFPPQQTSSLGITTGVLSCNGFRAFAFLNVCPMKMLFVHSATNLHCYEPEFWEFQYQCYRYLERAPDTEIVTRYEDILRNMRALVSRDRDVIPIQSFLSSWYLFRKEHQTRLEFLLRNVEPPIQPPTDVVFDNVALGAPARPAHPNAGDVLFRYDQRTHIERIATDGLIRIRPASGFKTLEDDRARQDDECKKKAFLPGAHTRITTRDGTAIPILEDAEKTTSMPDYYAFCMNVRLGH